MPKTIWTEKRLSRLFLRYNRLYWKGGLRNFSVSIAPIDYLGFCDSRGHNISINVESHKSDSEIRSTLLHEMAHAAAKTEELSHGYQFWAQIEHLLRRRAPINVSFSEAPGMGIVANAVPKSSPLARKAMNDLENRRQKQYARAQFDDEFEVDEAYVAERLEDAARLPWKQAALAVGSELGLLDVQGKPKNAWAKQAIARGKKDYLRRRKILSAFARHKRSTE